MAYPAFLARAHRPTRGSRAIALVATCALSLPLAGPTARGAAVAGLCGLPGGAGSSLGRQAALLLAQRVPASPRTPARDDPSGCAIACHLPGERKRRSA